MSKVKIVVVEDEIIIADNICDTLEDLGYEALEPAINYTEAIELIEAEKPDLAILDIQLSGRKTGIDIAEKIRKDYDFPFIFLTSNSDPLTVSQAKKVMPPAYLVKPFTKDELYTSIEIALYNYSKRIGEVNDEELIIKDAFFIKEKNVFIKLKFEDILFIKSEHVYAEIQLKNNQKHLIRGNLNKIITKLNKKFVRVHRSYIVNLDYLEQIDQSNIMILNNNIPIGKKYKDDLLQKINLL
ncbi:putative transcriptional regulatory protein pdtaR [Kordia sp. SMS9]|uniref:LytR/AlgR family response regulator transcription factor n=1 Tax=Kordia sp. SMS9 TaxID=2282170 RepID=UPI000E0DFF9A|nr:response regulator [Kordia sp. SMS9]AXG69342.1 putative transcriptional regulatory protein pdtaR [Kordia sp. SMS9]